MSSGFANFWWLEPDEKLRIHFDPGTRYSYSGEGFVLLQFVVENGKKSLGLGLDLLDLTQDAFSRLGMTRTSLKWRADFAPNTADAWNDKGEVQEHVKRARPKASGSMDTTISDYAKFTAALVRGDGLSAKSYAEMIRPQLKITTAHQFPTFGPELPKSQQRKDLYAGLGVIVFDGPQGPGFEKGGHDEVTGNSMVCLERSRNCVVLLSNDVRAEAAYAALVKFILGDSGVPYAWIYGDHAGKS